MSPREEKGRLEQTRDATSLPLHPLTVKTVRPAKRTFPPSKRASAIFLSVVGVLLLIASLITVHIVRSDDFSPPYEGTDYYQPTFPECPYYSAWTTACYGAARRQIDRDMKFMSAHGVGNFQRVWISLDQLFSCFDATTGFCGYDRQALANVTDTLRIMAKYSQKADLVLFAQPNRASDVHYFHVEALDGRHQRMRANYIKAATQFVEYLAADRVASSAVEVIDMENEGFYQNRRVLLELHTTCGTSGGCIDRNLSKPFLDALYEALRSTAPQFLYTVSALRGELLGPDMKYWVSMYPVDVYDVHLYITGPEQHTSLFAAVRELPKPWFSGEASTSNPDDSTQPCYTYDGNDPCTAATDTWWRQHLGRDYGAQAVLIEHYGVVFDYSDDGPTLTRTGRALANLA